MALCHGIKNKINYAYEDKDYNDDVNAINDDGNKNY